ncbi:MAG: DUF3488 domain-containing protein [Nitrospina sp.]|nr:DUF3488 domain-containing protein [Nitrospina sp.]
MPVRFCFLLFNYLLAILGVVCLTLPGLLWPFAGEIAALGLIALFLMELKGRIPIAPPAWFSLSRISLIALPALYFTLRPDIPALAAGFLLFVLYSRFVFKAEFNDYLYGYLISIVCLLVGALFVQDLTFAALFLSFYLVMCWALIFYHLMGERVGSRSPPERFARQDTARARVSSGILGLTAGLVLLSLVFTSAIFIAFPRLGLGFMTLNQSGVPISGFSDRVEFGEVGRIKQNEEVVLRATFTQNGRPFRPPLPALWRGVALDHFDGRVWKSTLPHFWSNPHRPGKPLALFSMKPEENVIREEIFMENIETPVIFTYGLPLAIDGTFTGLEMDAAFSFRMTDEPGGPRRFDTVADIGPLTGDVSFPILGYLDPEQARLFRQLPETSPELKALAKRLGGKARSDMETAEAMLRYLQDGFTYSLDIKKETDLPSIDEFLFHRKSGHCEYFASALTLLLRLGGIPARVVNGFMGVEWNEMGQYMIVRQTHAHSWVEAFFADRGWVVFDPTPPDPAAAESSPSRFSHYLDLLRLNWQRYVVKYNFNDQMEIAHFVSGKTRGITDTLRSLADWKPGDFLDALKNTPGAWGWVLLAIAGLGFAWKRLGRQEETLPPASRQYAKMLRKLEKQGLHKAPSTTAREFLEALDTLESTRREHVARITHLYEKSRFGGTALNAADEKSLEEMVRQV